MEGGKKRFDCFSIREYELGGEKKSAWNRIGVAFENRDGSMSVLLDSLPVDGKLQIRAYEPRERAAGEGERPADRVSEPARHEASGRGGNGRRKVAAAEEAF